LVTGGHTSLAHDWIAGWRKLAWDDPGALFHVNLHFRSTGKDEQASIASNRALELGPGGALGSCLATWVAFDEVMASRADVALRQLERVDPSDLRPFHHALFETVQRLVDVQRESPAARGPAARRAWQALLDLRQDYDALQSDPMRRRTWERAVRRLGEDA